MQHIAEYSASVEHGALAALGSMFGAARAMAATRAARLQNVT